VSDGGEGGFLEVIDEDASMPARGMMTPGLTEGEFTMDEHDRDVFDGEFADLCDPRHVLNEIITEIRGLVLSHNRLSDDGRRSQNCKGANLDC
jgi:hypothetical protein